MFASQSPFMSLLISPIPSPQKSPTLRARRNPPADAIAPWRHGFAALALLGAATLAQAVTPGSAAPAFSLTDLQGKPLTLESLRGQWVVLEWTNPECPFVRKHYDSGNMQATQRAAADLKVTWVQVNSTNAQHGEYYPAAKMQAWLASMKAAPTYATLDASGAVGKAYGAKTTPHMYLIDPNGKVAYNGAIDDKRSASPADIAGARNHIKLAMSEALAGKPVSVAATTPYGCSIKY